MPVSQPEDHLIELGGHHNLIGDASPRGEKPRSPVRAVNNAPYFLGSMHGDRHITSRENNKGICVTCLNPFAVQSVKGTCGSAHANCPYDPDNDLAVPLHFDLSRTSVWSLSRFCWLRDHHGETLRRQNRSGQPVFGRIAGHAKRLLPGFP